jgi:hypothetical protein
MAYQNLVTTEGRFNIPEILAHAHRKARIEFNAFLLLEAGLKVPDSVRYYGGDYIAEQTRLAATVDRSKVRPCYTYAELFQRELAAAWSWARAIQGAGQGEAPARTVPMWREAA